MNLITTERLTPTRDISQKTEMLSFAVEKELHEGGSIPSALPKKIFMQENGNNQGDNTKKIYAEILKNAKPKEIVKVVNTESH